MSLSSTPVGPIRWTIGITGCVFATYIVYTVLVALTANGMLTDAGLPPLRSGRWVAQTSLGSLFCVFAAFLALKAAYRPGVLTLAGFMVAQGAATGLLNSIAFAGVTAETWYIARALINWMAYALALRTTQLFPRALNPERMPGQLGGWVRILIGPRRVWVVSAALLGLSLLAGSDLAFQLGQLLVLAVAVATMAANYREGNREDREKIYWLLLGGGCLLVARLVIVAGRVLIDAGAALIGAGATDLSTGYGIVRNVSWTIANGGLLLALLMAVFYKGVIDPRLVVRKTAVYSFAVGLAVFAFAIFENYAVEVVSDVLGITEGLLEAVAGGLLALALKPLHDWLNKVLEAVLPRTDSELDGLEGSGAVHLPG